MSATGDDFFLLPWRDCAAVLRWSGHKLPVTVNLTCDSRGQVEIVVPSAPITGGLWDFHTFALAQTSSGGCSIEIRSASGQSASGHHLLLSRYDVGPETAELRLRCYELLATTPSGPERSNLYKYFVRGLLCDGRFPVSVDFDFGKLSILGPYSDDEQVGGSWGVIDVRPKDELTAAEIDAGVNRVLDVLSFAIGRSLRCSIRRRQVGGEVESRFWPHGDLPPRKWPPFCHLNLQPILAAAARTYSESVGRETGIGVAIQWVVAHSTYSSVRFVQLMIAVEHMIHAARSRVPLFPKPVFQEVSSKILQVIDEFKQTAQAAPYHAECGALSQNVSHLNQFAFKKQIRRLLEVYRVPLDGIGEHIDDLVDLRNVLVHRGLEPREPERPVIEHELILREIVTRTILAILEFEGVYQSWQDGTRKDATFSRTPGQTPREDPLPG